MELTPSHIVYVKSFSQQGRHVVDKPTLILLVKGYAYCRLRGPDGTDCFSYDGHTPVLLLLTPGMSVDFETTVERENGYIEFNADMVRVGKIGTVEIHDQEHWIEVPCYLPLSVDETSALRDEFEQISRLWKTPIPRHLFRVKAGIIGLLCRFIERVEPERTDDWSPAQQLRLHIDEDPAFSKNISELSQECGYSEDHLRKLFRERYLLSPLEYRLKQRMRHTMDLLLYTDLPLPEIAARTGFRHVSHFCTAFKQEFHMTPTQGRRRFR